MRLTTWRLLFVSVFVVTVVAAVEALLMIVLPSLPRPAGMPDWLLDALLLSAIAGPPVLAVMFWQVRQIDRHKWQQLDTQHAALLQLSSDGVLVADARGRIVSFNAGAEAMFGYSAAFVIGEPVHLLIPEGARATHQGHVDRFAKQNVTQHAMGARRTFTARRADGSEFPVDVSINRAEHEGEVSLLAIVRDVSERVAREAELEAARAAAERAAQSKSEFLANMSHEIRTPMNAVVGLTGLLLDSPLAPQQREYLEVVRSSSDNLLVILNDILDYSKIEAGRLELEKRPFCLRECVTSAVELLAHKAAEKGIELACDFDEHLPAGLVGDDTRLRQVIVNLVSNAVKFTDKGEVVVSARGEREADGRWAIAIDVRDTGIGIPADRLNRLFQSFSQADASTTRRFGGTGLGLAIARRLCAAMGGTVQVASEVGVGTTFTCTIRAPEAAPGEMVVSEPVDLSAHQDGARVLIVDDNETNRLILSRQLSRWGVSHEAVASAAEGFERLDDTTTPYALVITDIQMPEMDGNEFARRVCARPSAPPIIGVSSLGERPCEEIPWAAFLTKPVREQTLRREVAHALGASRVDVPPARVSGAFEAPFAVTHPLRILVAEDNPVNQMVIRAQLEQLGYRPDIVGNGLEVLKAAADVRYDVVLMDVQMPEMDGLQATRELRGAHAPKWPLQVVAMTASALDSDRDACLEAGMDAMISKPVTMEMLRTALTGIARKAEAA